MLLNDFFKIIETDYSKDNPGSFKVTIELNDKHKIFKGHFPGKPVLPGICKIQTVLVLCEKHRSAPVRLHEVIMGKFFTPVEGGDELSFDCSEVPCDGGRFRVRAHVSRGDERIARIDLLVSYDT